MTATRDFGNILRRWRRPSQPQDFVAAFDYADSVITITTAGQRLLGGDPNRYWVGFVVPAPAAGEIRVSPVADVASGRTFLVVTPLLEFWFTRHGPLVTGEWYGTGSFLPATVWVQTLSYRPRR